MLAKQCWKVLQDPNSLMSRILKSKYFHNDSFLYAKLGSSLSICVDKYGLGEGSPKFRIEMEGGDGTTIKNFEDPWIPRPFSFRVVTPENNIIRNWRVADIIDKDGGEWNFNLLRNVLWQVDCDEVAKIPLGLEKGSDKFIWHFDK